MTEGAGEVEGGGPEEVGGGPVGGGGLPVPVRPEHLGPVPGRVLPPAAPPRPEHHSVNYGSWLRI